MRNSIDHDYLSFRTLELPTTLWIELTSKCPFDCVFCSRMSRHGAGEHMDFGLYIAILDQLRSPEVIRLNYSGELLRITPGSRRPSRQPRPPALTSSSLRLWPRRARL